LTRSTNDDHDERNATAADAAGVRVMLRSGTPVVERTCIAHFTDAMFGHLIAGIV